VNVCPAIVIVPARAPPDMDATEYCTVPLPLPFAPEAIVSHDTALLADQAQPLPAVTVTLPLPPPAAALALVGEIEYAHPLPCVTVKG